MLKYTNDLVDKFISIIDELDMLLSEKEEPISEDQIIEIVK